MKVEYVLNIDYFKDKEKILETWMNEYNKYDDNEVSFLKDRLTKAYDIYLNNKEYDDSIFDGDFPLGNEYEASFANKHFSISDLVKLQLAKFSLIDYKDEYQKGFYHEIKKEYAFAYKHYIRIKDDDIIDRALYLRNKNDVNILKKELEKGNLKYIKKLEKDRITKDIQSFWNVCLETGYKEERHKKLMHQFQLGWRKLCANYGDPSSMYYLAISYVRGYPFEQDADLAYYYAKSGSDKKEYMATFILGMLYEEGFGCRKNMHRAIEAYELASSHGVMGAMLRLNAIYNEGKEDIKPNKNKANSFLFLDKDFINKK